MLGSDGPELLTTRGKDAGLDAGLAAELVFHVQWEPQGELDPEVAHPLCWSNSTHSAHLVYFGGIAAAGVWAPRCGSAPPDRDGRARVRYVGEEGGRVVVP